MQRIFFSMSYSKNIAIWNLIYEKIPRNFSKYFFLKIRPESCLDSKVPLTNKCFHPITIWSFLRAKKVFTFFLYYSTALLLYLDTVKLSNKQQLGAKQTFAELAMYFLLWQENKPTFGNFFLIYFNVLVIGQIFYKICMYISNMEVFP